MRFQISTLPILAALAVMASQSSAAAHVMAVASATIEVRAVVVASCWIDTGTGMITPGGTGSLASDLRNPTADEAAAGAATRSVTITY